MPPAQPDPRPAAPRLVLASASPRRRRLLAEAGVAFEVRPSEADESLEGRPEPDAAATELAERKARTVAALLAGEDRLVLGADTVVALDEPDGPRLLGKPADAAEAARMLSALAGTTHRVCTGVAVVDCRSGALARGCETTRVTMRPLDPEEVRAYVATGEWEGKAGGYAIQESADAFVTALEGGGFDNVVGLPVGLTLALLEELGAPPAGA